MGAFPTWSPGKILRASDLRGTQPDIIQASVTQSINMSVTSTRDQELFFRAEAGAQYLAEVYLLVNVSVANEIQYQWDVPSGATSRSMSWGATTVDASYLSRSATRVHVGAGFQTISEHRIEETVDSLIWGRLNLITSSVPGVVGIDYIPTIVAGTLNRDLYSFMRVTRYA